MSTTDTDTDTDTEQQQHPHPTQADAVAGSSELPLPLGTRIRNLRLQAGLSQQEVVDHHYSEPYLSRVERNQMQPSEEFLAFIASRLKVSVEALLQGTATSEMSVKKASREEQELILESARIAYQRREFDLARELLLTQVDKAQLSVTLQARHHYLLGQIELEKQNYKKALEDLQAALDLFLNNPRADNLETEQVRNSIGLVHSQMGNHYRAIEYHSRCIEALNNGWVQDRFFEMQVCYNLANEYQAVGDSEKALPMYKHAAELAEKGKNISELAGIYWGLGLTAYTANKNINNGKIFLNRSAALYAGIDELRLAATVKGILGNLLVEQTNFDQAEEALKDALEIAISINSKDSLYSAYSNIAYLRFGQKRLAEAEQAAIEAITQAKLLKNNLLLGQIQAQLADIKFAAGSTEEALKLYGEAVDLLEQSGDRQHTKQVCFRYANALKKAGKVDEAVDMYQKAYKYQQS